MINITQNTPGQLNTELPNLSTYLLATGLTDHERLLERNYIPPSTLLMILRLNFLLTLKPSYTEIYSSRYIFIIL